MSVRENCWFKAECCFYVVYPVNSEIFAGLYYCTDTVNKMKIGKSKITKILNSEENPIGMSLFPWQNQMTKHIKNELTRTVISLTSHRHFQIKKMVD